MMKTAIICKSDKDKNGLEVKSLKNEIKLLREEGYVIINTLSKE